MSVLTDLLPPKDEAPRVAAEGSEEETAGTTSSPTKGTPASPQGEAPLRAPALPEGATLAEAAEAWARAGWRVHPLAPEGKDPASRGGFHDGVDAPELARERWAARPLCNVGGWRPDVLVLDVDGPMGAATLATLEGVHGPLPPTLTVLTPGRGGGRHLLYRLVLAEDERTRGSIGAGLDVKGLGKGYTALPPSVHPDTGTTYRLDAEAPVQVADAPAWLRSLVVRTEPPKRPTGASSEPRFEDGQDGTPEGLRAFEGIVRRFEEEAEPGNRNRPLNGAAFGAGGLVASGHLDLAYAERRLVEAGEASGHDPANVRATVESGLRGGAASPLEPEPSWEVTLHGAPLGHGHAEGSESSGDVAGKYAGSALDWTTLWTEEDAEPEWVVQGFLEAGTSVSLTAGHKVGKSLLMLDVACSVAKGADVLGLAVPRPRRVVYVDMENRRADIRRRLADLGYGPEDAPWLRERLTYYVMPPLPMLDTAAGAGDLLALVEAVGAEVVVLDTFSRVVEGEENSADTYRAYYSRTGLALKARGVTVVRLDHSGHEGTRARGSSAKGDDVDALWTLRQEGQSQHYTLALQASRQGDLLEQVQLSKDGARFVPRLSAPKASEVLDLRLMEAVSRLLESHEGEALGRKRVRAGVSARTQRVDAALVALVERGYVAHDTRTGYASVRPFRERDGAARDWRDDLGAGGAA